MPKNSPIGGLLPAHANLENLKKQAKSLLRNVRAADPTAIRRVEAVYSTTLDLKSIQLSNVQFVIAHEYGFASWPKLKAALDGPLSQRDQEAADLFDGPREVPLVPMRDFVIFPGMTVPIFMGREKTINALMAALPHKPMVACVQLDERVEVIGEADIYRFGTLVTPLHWNRFKDGTIRVLIKADESVRIDTLDFSGNYIRAVVSPIPAASDDVDPQKVRSARALFIRLANDLELPTALTASIENASGWDQLADLALTHLHLSIEDRQRLLEMVAPAQRLDFALDKFSRVESELNEIRIADYGGHYHVAPDYFIDVSLEEKRLMVRTPWDRHALRPKSKDVFWPVMESPNVPEQQTGSLSEVMARTRSPIRYHFLRGDKGEVYGVVRTDDTGAWPTAHHCELGREWEAAPPVSLKKLQLYAGRYEAASGCARSITCSITLRDGRLLYDDLKLCPINNADFMGKSEALRISFKANDAGRIVGMRVRTPKATSQFYKMD